ncbi:hypothetical protein BDF14DRAFT_1834197 [Spinellus fusiger]|nr:hypothetical protein BDF14DRAFT_1834197 [Spinellus fusiger]
MSTKSTRSSLSIVTFNVAKLFRKNKQHIIKPDLKLFDSKSTQTIITEENLPSPTDESNRSQHVSPISTSFPRGNSHQLKRLREKSKLRSTILDEGLFNSIHPPTTRVILPMLPVPEKCDPSNEASNVETGDFWKPSFKEVNDISELVPSESIEKLPAFQAKAGLNKGYNVSAPNLTQKTMKERIAQFQRLEMNESRANPHLNASVANMRSLAVSNLVFKAPRKSQCVPSLSELTLKSQQSVRDRAKGLAMSAILNKAKPIEHKMVRIGKVSRKIAEWETVAARSHQALPALHVLHVQLECDRAFFWRGLE